MGPDTAPLRLSFQTTGVFLSFQQYCWGFKLYISNKRYIYKINTLKTSNAAFSP